MAKPIQRKISTPKKNSLKNFSYFIFQETETLTSFLYFWKWNFLTLTLKNLLYSGKWNLSVHPEKISYTSGSGNPAKTSYIFSKYVVLLFQETENLKNFLYFRKRNFLMFQERNIQNPGITEGSYISRNVAFYPYTSLIFQVASFQARKMNKKPARKKFLYIRK